VLRFISLSLPEKAIPVDLLHCSKDVNHLNMLSLNSIQVVQVKWSIVIPSHHLCKTCFFINKPRNPKTYLWS